MQQVNFSSWIFRDPNIYTTKIINSGKGDPSERKKTESRCALYKVTVTCSLSSYKT